MEKGKKAQEEGRKFKKTILENAREIFGTERTCNMKGRNGRGWWSG